MQFIDLFCGGGFGARGAVAAGMQPLLAVDAWSPACDTYKANFPSATVLNKRIEDVDPLNYVLPGQASLLIASPECTNHSYAKGGAPRVEASKETALYTVRWIEVTKPRWFVIENVKEMKLWSRYRELLDRLSALGYQTSEEILDAAEFGAPQSRNRLFLIGDLHGVPPKIAVKTKKRRTVLDILDVHGTWPESRLFTEKRAIATVARARNAIKTLGSNAEFLIVYYGAGGDKSWQSLDRPLRTVTTNDRFALVRKDKNKWVMRMLQPSELSRAMALPDQHYFALSTRSDKIKLCGNGVCSSVMKSIVSQLIKQS
jgi:DNA (cytosine-5)-methyltransferase 1